MRIGIFSDVHSNIEALTTVLGEYEALEAPIDRFVCLGDVVGYGANPNECCEIVREMAPSSPSWATTTRPCAGG